VPANYLPDKALHCNREQSVKCPWREYSFKSELEKVARDKKNHIIFEKINNAFFIKVKECAGKDSYLFDKVGEIIYLMM
jgi:hypothetical protein